MTVYVTDELIFVITVNTTPRHTTLCIYWLIVSYCSNNCLGMYHLWVDSHTGAWSICMGVTLTIESYVTPIGQASGNHCLQLVQAGLHVFSSCCTPCYAYHAEYPCRLDSKIWFARNTSEAFGAAAGERPIFCLLDNRGWPCGTSVRASIQYGNAQSISRECTPWACFVQGVMCRRWCIGAYLTINFCIAG